MKTNTEFIIVTGTYNMLSNNSWLPIFPCLNENDYQMFMRPNLFYGNHGFHMLILISEPHFKKGKSSWLRPWMQHTLISRF